MAEISVGGTALPSPTGLQVDDEIIWSSDSGRDLSGLFSGDVIAQKKSVTVSWGILTAAEVAQIQNSLTAGYLSVTIQDAAGSVTISAYRGTLSKVLLGTIAGTTYYKSVSCKIVQR